MTRGRGLSVMLLGGLLVAAAVGRQVEQPNSHFNPAGVHHRDIATPWDGIDLEGLHEVNRELVTTLLARARALGPGHLRPGEVELLDRMAHAAAAGRTAGARGRRPEQPGP